jgi:hypothetical protein
VYVYCSHIDSVSWPHIFGFMLIYSYIKQAMNTGQKTTVRILKIHVSSYVMIGKWFKPLGT